MYFPPPLQFGIGPGQKASLDRIQKPTEDQKFIHDLLSEDVNNIAAHYANPETPSDKLPLIEKALIIKLNRATESYRNNKCQENSLKMVLLILDFGRLKNQDLPDALQKALETAVEAYCQMKARLPK